MPWCENMRRCAQIAWVAGAVLWATPLRAAQPLDLSWQAPPGCPQEGTVREQIRAIVPSAALESGRLKAEGTITRVDKRFRLKLVLHLGELSGERSIYSDSCSDLAGAAVVALGLLLQTATTPTVDKPGATSEATPAGAIGSGTDGSGTDGSGTDGSGTDGSGKNATKPGAEPEPAPSPMEPDETEPSPPSGPRSWRVFVAPQLTVELGPMPEPSLGVALAAGLSAQEWRFFASFAFPRDQQLRLAGLSGAGAELEHWAAEAWTCRAFRSATLELAPCLLVGWESLTASGNGPGVEARSEQTSWVSGGAAAIGRWYVADWFAFAASVAAKVEGARPTISIDGVGDYGRLKPVAFSLRAGPVWIF
jgi:hypothetical protein